MTQIQRHPRPGHVAPLVTGRIRTQTYPFRKGERAARGFHTALCFLRCSENCIVNELKRQVSITELERAMAERVSSCSFIHLLICFTALRSVKLDESHCQVAMLQADLEAQKAVEPVSSSRESEEECFNIQKPIGQ